MSAADALIAAPSREPARRRLHLLPLVVIVMTSLKPLDEVTGGHMFWLPEHLTLEPGTKAWGTACVGLTCAGEQIGKGYVWNSVKMVVPAVII